MQPNMQINMQTGAPNAAYQQAALQFPAGINPALASPMMVSAPVTVTSVHRRFREYCCIHGKERGMAQLIEVGQGMKGFRCREGEECKGVVISSDSQESTLAECSLHGKRRSTAAMDWVNDAWRCKAGCECISNITTDDKKICSVHQKLRTMEALQPAEAGSENFVCKPGQRCKGGARGGSGGQSHSRVNSTAFICVTHNKKRGAKYLDPHPTLPGMWICKPDETCF